MKIRLGIEYRLTAWYAVLLLAGLTVLAAAMWMMLQQAVHAEADDRLRARLRGIIDIVSFEADSASPQDVEEELIEYLMGVPEGALTQVRDAEGRQVFPPLVSADAETVADPPIPWENVEAEPLVATVRSPSGAYRVLAQRIRLLGHEYRVSVASSLRSLEETRARLVGSLLLAIPLALLACAVSGLTIARRALAPVEAVTRAASEITVENLERRIPVPETGDALERLTRTFNEMLERLRASVARIEEFSTDASHELRTPISVIHTTAELALRHGRTNTEYRSDLEAIQDEARRLKELIEVLLTLARRDTTDDVPMIEVDLGALVIDVCRPFARDVESKALALTVQTPDTPTLVRGHDPALRRLLMLLLENALAHTSRGSIGVSLTREDNTPILSVRDTGEGIPDEAIGRVFDRFYRVDAARSRVAGRLGVGLSIAKRIADLHAAEIRVTSHPGEGSEFVVRFPAPQSAVTDESSGRPT